MPLLFLVLGLANAAKPSLCASDWASQIPASSAGTFIDPDKFLERVLRPGVTQVQLDLCRCLPRRSRKRPSQVGAELNVEPNQGTMKVEYSIQGPHTDITRKMRSCLGVPVLNFEPIPYVSDILLEDGQRGGFPRYPIVVETGNPKR